MAKKNRGKGHATPSSSNFGHDYSKDYSDPEWPYAKGQMDKFAKFVLILTPLVISLLIAYYYHLDVQRERVRTPLGVPKIISSNATSAAEDPARFWGTYRSNVYFGLKTRSPKSPVVGLMWMTQFAGERSKIRHWCDQGDGLPMYGWFTHDGVNFGLQEILDEYYSITTTFVKRPGGDHGGDWTATVGIKPRPGAENAIVSLFFYTALDGQGYIEPQLQKNRLTTISGFSEELGNFQIKFPKPEQNAKKFNYLSTYVPNLAALKDYMAANSQPYQFKKSLSYLGVKGRVVPAEFADKGINFLVHQVTVALPFEMTIVFESGSFHNRPNTLEGDIYMGHLKSHSYEFDTGFEKTFGLEKKGYNTEMIRFSKAALSNMLGGMGYFYGHSFVKSKYVTEQAVPYWDAPLFTGVPSRSFFPRGFLWDEGFHNLLISKWDQKISMDIIGHWLDLMNIEGWIPREQILGLEARARVPSEFVVQHNENANPPTLFLPLQGIVKNLAKSTNPKDVEYLRNLFPRLKVWYSWFNNSQIGDKPFTYRWRGRDEETKRELNPKTLTSGLDDYPRASHPTSQEYHLDLRCWMALASKVMMDIAKSLKVPFQDYANTYQVLTDNKILDELHWSEKGQMYADYGLHTDHVKLSRPKPKPTTAGQRPGPIQEKIRFTNKEPVYTHVDSFGYVSLFPFLLKIVEPDSLKLGKILQDLEDPNLLWTNYGLRSLSKSAPLYNKYNTEHDPPYWRGPIWININYLAIGALHHYSNIPGPYQTKAAMLYQSLRENVINNIFAQYKATGFIWEHYDCNNGKGKGTHPFTGWSALVVAIMAEEY